MKQGLVLLCTLTLLCGAKGTVIFTLAEESVAISEQEETLCSQEPSQDALYVDGDESLAGWYGFRQAICRRA